MPNGFELSASDLSQTLSPAELSQSGPALAKTREQMTASPTGKSKLILKENQLGFKFLSPPATTYTVRVRFYCKSPETNMQKGASLYLV